MLWRVFQTAIMIAVLYSAVYYQWAEGTSMVAVSLVAIFSAWVATASIFAVMDLAARLKSLLLRRQ